MLPIDQVGELLSRIPEDKKISFDRDFAEELYRRYNEDKEVDDGSVIDELKNELKGKRVLLIAPGKSVKDNLDIIKKVMSENDVLTIALNPTLELPYDYLLTTRQDIYNNAVSEGKSVIVPSNISKGGRGNVKILNYANWIEISEGTNDSSSVIALNVLAVCEVKKIILAGFDGFSVNINDNYYDPELRHPVSIDQVDRRNNFYKGFFKRKIASGMKIEFLTPSIYQK